MANGKLKLQQTCIFAHQNVPADDAASAMIHGRQKMMDKLDKMTHEAANQEGLANITSFNQVIKIDPKSHMWYFSDLYFGDPPMAPINLGYSEKVAEVRDHILFDIALKKKMFLSVSETICCIEDLWNGILSDDFVFSFRNSLEMKAYYSMESKFNKLTWNIENETYEFIRSTATVKLARCATDEALDRDSSLLVSELRNSLLENQTLCLEKWNNFIDNCSLREMMEQWRQSRVIKLNEFVYDLERKAIKSIKNHKKQIAADLVRTKKRTLHQVEMKQKASNLAARCKEKMVLSIKLIWNNFNEMWQSWAGDLEQESTMDDKPVKDQIEETLYDQFLSDRPLITKELQIANSFVLSSMLTRNRVKLQFSFPSSRLNEGDISFQPNLHLNRATSERVTFQAMEFINIIFAKIDSFISGVACQDAPFAKTHVTSIFIILTDSIDQHNTGYGVVTFVKFTSALKVKLAVHITKYITAIFTDLEMRYRKNHNIAAQMKDYKNMIWQQFRDTVTNEHDNVKMTNVLVDIVEKLVVEEIEQRLPVEVVKMVIDECFSTKYSLMLAIMKSLAEEEDFKKFHWYIIDSKSFAQEWITKFTKRKLFSSSETDNRYTRIVTVMIHRYLFIIRKSLESTKTVVKKEKRSMSSWISEFERKLAVYLPISFNLFDFLKDSNTLDCGVVNAHFQEQLKNCEKRLIEVFAAKVGETRIWKGSNPYTTIFDKLWGCEHTCPFCKETCQKTSKCHPGEQHACVQHRPPGLKGVRQVETQYMSWESCNYKVYSNISFYCGASDSKCQLSGRCKATNVVGNLHFYRDYGTLIPDWEIEPSPRTDTSLYWMWFTHTFKEKLEQIHCYIMPPDIDSWRYITKRQAIESLRMRGHLAIDI